MTKSHAATRSRSRARGLPLTFPAPGAEPCRHILVTDAAPVIQFLEASLNLIELPALCFDKGGNGLGGEKRLGATRALGERLEALLLPSRGIDTNGKAL